MIPGCARNTLSFLLAVLTLSAMSVLAIGCGDSTLARRGVVQEASDTDLPQPDVAGDALPDEACCIMVPATGSRDVTVDMFGMVDIGVILLSRETGGPVPSENISFVLLDNEGGANLSERNAVTDEDGFAKVAFVAGEAMRDYVVRAEYPGANNVEFFITVEDVPSGNIEVSYTNGGESVYDIPTVTTYVFPRGVMSCNEFRPLRQLPDTYYVDESTIDGTSTFTALSVEETWTVLSIGRGEFGQMAAAGCRSDVYLRENETVQVDLVLTLLPLNPVGQYDSISHWDFTETLEDAGTVGAILLQVFSLFEDPGRFLYDQIINLIREFVGGLIAVAVDTFFDLTGLDDLLADAVNGFIEGNEFLSRLRQAGLDLRDMVTHLEVISTLTIGKIGSDYQVYGADDWLGLAIYWRWNCVDDPDPQCGRIELSLDPNSSLGLVYGEWNGQVSAYNQLQIYPHAINLHYGRLIVYVLNEIILPELTDGNAHNMTDAILYWIGCEDFGMWVTGSDGEICALSFCLQADSIATACESVVRTVFGIGEYMLGNLEVESVMEMSGSATLVERDGDLEVDEIVDGQYTGTVNISGSRSPFTATWSATKRPRNDDSE